ncbi:pectinesterase-like [Salvia miltiorrhiza]|uniref:pectinesterase-like n=1 Tax=Salvia miltiorrhiza TaxID=226208 RepID=UPI0025AB6D23|nr:pectinesterase-like [Salvia miltiorrhiza]
MGDSKSRVVVLAVLATVLLLAAVIAAVVVFSKGEEKHDGGKGGGGSVVVSASKAVKLVCSPTDYKETCEKSLAGANTTDPKKLIEAAFDATVGSIMGALESSAELKKVATDPSTKGAFDVCDEVLHNAVDDLKSSITKVAHFDAGEAKALAADLRTRLAAVGDDQETCTDAFENTTGDTGEKMKALLKTAKEMSSNGLAMVSDLSAILGSLQLAKFLGGGGGGGGSARRLMAEEAGDFVDRRILKVAALKPTMVVAKDGSGQFKTISAALKTLPKKNNETFIVIHIKAGVYAETVIIPKKVNKVVLLGDGPKKTVITGKLSFAGGVKTYHTATVAVNADEFIAKDLTIENTAGSAGHQAVALRVSGDRAVLYNVNMFGYQDTLYAHKYRQFYRSCVISGTIDFIFGDALAIFQDCTFVVRKPGPNQACMVTAQGRIDPRSPGGFVLQSSRIVAEPALQTAKPAVKVYLGRPWKELSRTIIMHSDIGGFIDPTGWSPWTGDFAINTCYYGEYENKGAGSDTSGRVTWKGIKKITSKIAQSWTGGAAYGDDSWIKAAGVPYVPTMMQV